MAKSTVISLQTSRSFATCPKMTRLSGPGGPDHPRHGEPGGGLLQQGHQKRQGGAQPGPRGEDAQGKQRAGPGVLKPHFLQAFSLALFRRLHFGHSTNRPIAVSLLPPIPQDFQGQGQKRRDPPFAPLPEGHAHGSDPQKFRQFPLRQPLPLPPGFQGCFVLVR